MLLQTRIDTSQVNRRILFGESKQFYLKISEDDFEFYSLNMDKSERTKSIKC